MLLAYVLGLAQLARLGLFSSALLSYRWRSLLMISSTVGSGRMPTPPRCSRSSSSKIARMLQREREILREAHESNPYGCVPSTCSHCSEGPLV